MQQCSAMQCNAMQMAVESVRVPTRDTRVRSYLGMLRWKQLRTAHNNEFPTPKVRRREDFVVQAGGFPHASGPTLC